MKKFFVFLAALFLAGAGTARSASVLGQLYYPFTKLYTHGTKYFDIIYSGDTKETAAYLSTFADETFERINGILKTKYYGRITVVVASGPQTENGFSLPFPYTHIVIADYLAHDFVNHREYIRDLFVHELTHAVSLNVKSDLFHSLCGIFGNYLSPNYSMPEFMIEGVTVSFESMDGNGRVNDPLVSQQIRQDILEGRFKNPAQATGAYDLYPKGDIYYHYGGYFSGYLQKKYGMEKYSRLWSENGGAFPYTLPLVFDKVYQTNIFDEWQMFRDSMRYNGLVETNVVFAGQNCAMKRKNGADFAVVSDGKIIFSDSFGADVKMYDPRTDRLETLFDGTGELAVSPDGKILLVTSLASRDGVYTRNTRFYDLEGRRFLDRRLEDLAFASFFGENIIAIRTRGHKTDLVVIGKDNSVSVLLNGTEKMSFYHPLLLDSNRIVFIMKDDGKRRIASLDMKNGEVSVLEPAGGIILDFPVALGVSDSKLFFSFNSDSSFYKAAVLDGNTLYLQTNNVSGGVFNLIQTGTGLYYIGRFSEGNLLLKYPASLENWNGARTGYSWKTAAIQTGDNPSNYPALNPSDYNQMPYLLPHFFIPYLTLGKDSLPDSVGIYTVQFDPLYDNFITLISTYNFYRQLLNVNVDWDNTSLPVNLHAAFADTISYRASIDGYIRQTGGYLDLSYTMRYDPAYYYLTVGGRLSDYLGAYDNGKPSAYLWDYTYSLPVWSLYIVYSTATAKYYFYDYKGFSLGAYYDYNINSGVYKSELGAYWYPSVIPLVMRLNAAYSFQKIFSLGGFDSSSFGSHHYPAFKEYASITNASEYFVSGELKVPVFDLEIQQGLWLLPLYFNRFYLTAGYRGAYLEAGYFQSVFARAVLITSPIYGGYVPNVNFYFEVNYRINRNEWGIDYNYVIDF